MKQITITVPDNCELKQDVFNSQRDFEIPYYLFKDVIDWLIAHYFDYYGLIPMGLALPATEGYNPMLVFVSVA